MTSPSMIDLPEVCFQHISCFLADSPRDVLSFTSSARVVHHASLAATFWKQLTSLYKVDDDENNEPLTLHAAKQAYLLQASLQRPRSVRWLPLRGSMQVPSAREGHLACVLDQNLIVTGGYSEDTAIHVKNVDAIQDWRRLNPTYRSRSPCFAYGATLTPLNQGSCLRFGGFRSGGYAAECSELALLHLLEDGTNMTAEWEIVQERHEDPPIMDSYLARAYHTATLVGGRYLLVIGGMQSNASILNPAVLDTETWTWSIPRISDLGPTPSPRHGHSVVLDEKRGRLVLFGGGNGSDLLRSGTDNTEVWALEMGQGWEQDFHNSFPWRWSRLHEDEENVMAPNEPLSPAEGLCLGRCHVGCKISPDTVMLVFGSGRPSTNGLVAYDLSRDLFFRPSVTGCIPAPRFTCASVYLPKQGYMFFHGGFTTQRSESIDDILLLDLAPAVDRELRAFAVDPLAQNHELVSDEEALRHRRDRGQDMIEHILFSLWAEREEERQETARRMLERFGAAQLGGRASMLLHMVSTGQVTFTRGVNAIDEEEDDDDSDGEDYMSD